jgi:hypothetical protein
MDTGKGIAGGGAATRGTSASSSISNLLVVDANPEVVGRDEIEQLLDVGNGRKLFQRGSCMEATTPIRPSPGFRPNPNSV